MCTFPSGCSRLLRFPNHSHAANHRHRQRGRQCQAGAGVERDGWRGALVQFAEDEGAYEHSDAAYEVVEAETAAAGGGRDDVADPRSFGAFGQGARDGVDDEEDEEERQCTGVGEGEVDEGVTSSQRRPMRSDSAPAAVEKSDLMT